MKFWQAVKALGGDKVFESRGGRFQIRWGAKGQGVIFRRGRHGNWVPLDTVTRGLTEAEWYEAV